MATEEALKLHFMRRAIELSRRAAATGDGEAFGSVIVRDDKIIGEGWNHIKVRHDPTAHGEVEAIRNTCSALKTLHLTGAEIYTNCEPCIMCAAVIQYAGIVKIYYGTTTDDISPHFEDEAGCVDVKAVADDLRKATNQRRIPAEQLLPGEAIKVFDEFHPKKTKS
ncbi:uncharacterized protein LOC106176276 [Lingula anatina]|uniref:Uncharacterized protein LOC106176276 n=1 Tax=Lingula anatina TaxID=7574 RepID=A0A1S3JUU4_LINAN|nr:uncharacterized protein LOC106176276 [Lingula anatina]|eukprot:XP_013414087.1 uncharacterized protein LOC106176276 [Lingula anatina]